MSLFTKGDIAIEYPVTINKTICIPNSNKFQNPLYQESTILKKDVPSDIEEINRTDNENEHYRKSIFNASKRENLQRNHILEGLKNSNPNDWVIISDLDEIPNPKKIINFKANFKYAFFEQKFLSFKFNILNKSQSNWYGSRICVKKFLKSPQWLRSIKIKKRNIFKRYLFNMNYKIITEGGWHFSNIKSPEKIIEKTNAFCHGELNQEKFKKKDLIKNKIGQLKDIYDRDIKYEKIEIDMELIGSTAIEDKL